MEENQIEISKTESVHDNPTYDGNYYFDRLLKCKYFILAMVILSTSYSVWYAKQLPDWFASSINIIQPQTSGGSGGISGLSGALRDMGMTSKIGKGGDGYTPMAIFESRSLKDSIIEKFNLSQVYDIPKTRLADLRDAFDGNIEVGPELQGNYVIKIYDRDPVRSRDMVKAYYELVNEMTRRINSTEYRLEREHIERRVAQTDSILAEVGAKLSAFSSATGMFEPKEQARSFSSAIAELQTDKFKEELLLDMMKNRYGDNDAYTKLQKKHIDEIQQQIENIKTKPGFMGNFSLNGSSTIAIQFLSLQTQFETFSKVKAFLLPMMEESRVNESKAGQAFIVLDSAIVPDRKAKPKRSVIVAGTLGSSFVLSVVISLAWISFTTRRKSSKRKK